MVTKKLIGVILLFLSGASAAFCQYDVPYVPTDYAVVDSMLSMAQVKKGERLYDLGCGDGRIVVIAAKNFGASAVGIDIDPQRIIESKAKADSEGVTTKVEFREQNIFDADFSDANIIIMYLLNSVNLRLRPILFRDLKPGTRVISHAFTMSSWEPEKTMSVVRLDGRGIDHLFYWVIPANVSGDWTYDTGNNPHALHIDQLFQKITGALTVRGNTNDVFGMTLTVDRIHFASVVTRNDTTFTYTYDGQANGDHITGTINNSVTKTTSKWEAVRDPKTKEDIAPTSPEEQEQVN